MKTKILSLLLLVSFTFIIIGCGKKAGPLACAADSVRYSEDFSAFAANQTKGNCEAVKKSITTLYKSCTSFAAADKASYEEFQNDFNCNDYK